MKTRRTRFSVGEQAASVPGDGCGHPVRGCDSIDGEKGLFPVVTLKAKSGNEGWQGKSEAQSFAEGKIR